MSTTVVWASTPAGVDVERAVTVVGAPSTSQANETG